MTAVIQTYATLIRKGLKTLEQVPAQDRAEVEQILVESGYLTEE